MAEGVGFRQASSRGVKWPRPCAAPADVLAGENVLFSAMPKGRLSSGINSRFGAAG